MSPGRVTARVVDHHVHLQLVDVAALADSDLAGVVDLGANPSVVAGLAGSLSAAGGLQVSYVGAFLAAPGGYPSDRAWCPPGAVREVLSPADAGLAVAEQISAGASAVKVTLHADSGPALDAGSLAAIVVAAHAYEVPVPVVAHVEGAGMTELAIAAGVDALAHTPWTERLEDDVVRRAADAGQAWISTLAIHAGDPAGEAVALDNLARFHTAGGRVLYGTDLGNGDLPLGVNDAEVDALRRAGLDDAALATALSDPWPLTQIALVE